MLTDLYAITLQDAAGQISIPLGMDEYVHEQSDGFAMPPLVRYQESSPALHGAVDRGFRLQPRRLTFRVALRAATPVEFYNRRAELLRVLRPHYYSAAALLSITLPDGSTWQLSVFCTQLTFTPPRGLVQSALFTLIAPHPVYTQYIAAATLHFYQADINTSKVVPYSGEWVAVPYPFSLRGPLSHPVIRNLTGDTRLDLDYAIPDNQTVNVDLRPSFKTIQLGGVSLLGYLSSDSDLEGFCLYPAPEAPNGNNVIQVTGANAGANTRVSISFTPTRLAI